MQVAPPPPNPFGYFGLATKRPSEFVEKSVSLLGVVPPTGRHYVDPFVTPPTTTRYYVINGVASGVTILIVEHVMQAVMSLCDTVFVLAQGRIIASGTPATVSRDASVIEAYLGHGAAARMQAVGGAATDA